MKKYIFKHFVYSQFSLLIVSPFFYCISYFMKCVVNKLGGEMLHRLSFT